MFNRVDLVPLEVGKPTQMEIDVAVATGTAPPQSRFVNTIDDVVEATITEHPGGPTISAARALMEQDPVYREWQTSMPPLNSVPNLHTYRNAKTTPAVLQGAQQEIQTYGDTLDAGQFLFRGTVHSSIPPNEPISTSMLPSVALAFAIRNSGAVWVLRVRDANIVRAFAFSTRGNQKNRMEMEVLLEANLLIAQYQPTQTIICGQPDCTRVPIDVFYYDLYK